MLKSDAIDLFDLSEAGRLLFRDPVRLAREARLRRVPATWIGDALAFPVAWVEAEAGVSAVDPEALRSYWLERLAPPSPDARRAVRERERLPATALLPAAEAARRIFADPRALRRLDQDGTLPSVRVDGVPHYDEVLTALVAKRGEGEDVDDALRARTAQVRDWARFEYATVARREGDRTVPVEPRFGSGTPAASDAPSEVRAFEIPSDLGLDTIAPLPPESDEPPPRIIEADGFDVVDED
ncbi:MAG: hypothetical protein QNJ98_14150 [Planctomycetota bacterium]|nr:hypothetical protein [Planctomycetota bacterium]